MQFKHPEILWALFLLLIPIIIHLFQLRRFKKTPFTNVKLLQKVVSQSRKSSAIKKWLILFSRLGLLAALVLAFAQPFSANTAALQSKETVFYLDNSFSMQAKTDTGTLLQNTVQDFIKNIHEGQVFTLFTNENIFEGVAIRDIQNSLLELPISNKQLTLEEILLKANTYFSAAEDTQKNTVLISDFQERMGFLPSDALAETSIHLIKPKMEEFINVSIDSVYLGKMNTETMEVIANVSSNTNIETTPVSLYNDDKLIAKTAAKFDTNGKAKVNFSIPINRPIYGRLVISDTGLSYDNQFYFNIDAREKIKVLSVGSVNSSYLKRIFTDDEFDYVSFPLNQLNYGSIDSQNLIILNELETIPTGLITALQSFITDGGSVVVVPAVTIDISSYNGFSTKYGNARYSDKTSQEVFISEVVFNHPLYQNVFEKNVSNFQYPKVFNYYTLKSNTPTALNLQNKAPFLVGNTDAYFFSASLNSENSTFKNSPLIVPTFYNMAINSLKLPNLYGTLGERLAIDIPVTLTKDNILKVSKDDYEFIPQQRLLPKKVSLSFKENPINDGIFQIKNNETTLRNISFNYNRKESDLKYLDIAQMNSTSLNNSVSEFFEETQKANSINEFWKWFAILALLFVLIETILQRFLK